MSAIWGMIDFKNADVNDSYTSHMNAAYQNYTFDRLDTASVDHAFFACCHQHLTPEAYHEVLPFHDTVRNILFTADCILDNRTELLTHFPELCKQTPDARILYECYIKWGQKLGDFVLGAFTFAAYHYKESYVTLWTDHMCHRSLYYSFHDNILYFSTLLSPLAAATNAPVCEKWITGCLATTSADMMVYKDLSPYEGIFQVNAAHTLTFSANKLSSHEYWTPLNLRPNLHFASIEEARQHFLTLFTDCIRSVLRSTGNTGCTLSSGLDSSSVACLTASLFREKNQDLYSYTSVPLPGFSENNSRLHITDETPGVQTICRHYKNIRPTFLPCENKDAFTELERLVPLLGYPMKSGHNLTWLDEIYRTAARDNCKLMLKGQFGNSTISYGPALTVIYQKLCDMKLFAAYRIMTDFGKNYHVPRKKILGFMAKEFYQKMLTPSLKEVTSLSSPALLKKHNTMGALKKTLRSSGGGQMDSRKQRLSFLFSPYSLTQLGMFDTSMGLLHGLLIRDPTKDKRIVEFCASLPVEYCLCDSYERGMIRSFMKGIVPDEILFDIYRRGLQSADYAYRSQLLWKKQKDTILTCIRNSELPRYTNRELVNTLLDRMYSTPEKELTQQDFIKTNVLYSCSLFLNHINDL